MVRNILKHNEQVNFRSDIGPVIDSSLFALKSIQNYFHKFKAPAMAIYDKLTYPFGRIFRLKKNLSDERSIKNNYNRIDLTTAARFSYDINYRRYKYADYMMQLHYPYHQTTFKCLLQLTPIMDTLYLPAD